MVHSKASRRGMKVATILCIGFSVGGRLASSSTSGSDLIQLKSRNSLMKIMYLFTMHHVVHQALSETRPLTHTRTGKHKRRESRHFLSFHGLSGQWSRPSVPTCLKDGIPGSSTEDSPRQQLFQSSVNECCFEARFECGLCFANMAGKHYCSTRSSTLTYSEVPRMLLVLDVSGRPQNNLAESEALRIPYLHLSLHPINPQRKQLRPPPSTLASGSRGDSSPQEKTQVHDKSKTNSKMKDTGKARSTHDHLEHRFS